MDKLEKVTLELPPDLARQLAAAGQNAMADVLQRGLRDLHAEQALERYRQGNVSFGAAAEMAGLSQSELAIYARAHGIEPFFSDETLAEELR